MPIEINVNSLINQNGTLVFSSFPKGRTDCERKKASIVNREESFISLVCEHYVSSNFMMFLYSKWEPKTTFFFLLLLLVSVI